MTTKKVIILSSAILLASVGIYVYLKNRIDSSSFQKEIAVKLDTSIDPYTIPEAEDEVSEVAIINDVSYILQSDGTYISENGDIYDPSTESLTTEGDSGKSTHIDASQVTLKTN